MKGRTKVENSYPQGYSVHVVNQNMAKYLIGTYKQGQTDIRDSRASQLAVPVVPVLVL
jgi:hypothetical protein